MPIPNMSHEQMRSALKELEQAVYNHEQWAEGLFGTLICHLAPDRRDIGEAPHRTCRFGQWYYKSGIAALERYPGIAELGVEHERMHQYAASLLQSSMDGVPISIRDYERFVTALKRLRLEIATVQREIGDALYSIDPLTGTPGRIGMLTKLREQHELVKRRVHACTIAMMDLDQFKAVNDMYGHSVGDKVLIAFARYVMAHLRPYDKIFRYGGEEFLICLPDTDLQAGRDIIERFREELASLPFEAESKARFHVTVSSGLTLLDPDVSVEQAIDRADKALYAAKAAGRNLTLVWDETMNGSPAAAVASA
jgi:diguanylate cyclase